MKHSTSYVQLLCQILMLMCMAFFAGCSGRYNEVPAYVPSFFSDEDNDGVGRFKTSYLIGQIDNLYRGSDPGPIGVTTLVNLDDLYSTSSFGRMYAEQLMSELAMKGYDVVELRHSDALQFMNNAGEFGLSRDTTAVKEARNLGGILVGTYSASPLRVYVNVRLIDPKSSIVLSAGSVEMSKTKEIARMIRGGSLANSMERIPVKHLDYTTYPAMMMPNFMGNRYEQEEVGMIMPSMRGQPTNPIQIEPKLK
jgi:TolB-like protein